MREETKRNLRVFAIAIAIPLGIGIAAAWLTRDHMQIYKEVQTPPLSPPSVLFPIVWTVLYLFMGISSGMIWKKRPADPKTVDRGLSFYAVSLAFNFAWSIFFFNFQQYLFAFFWLLILWGLILGTILCYRKISPAAAYLQIPYAVWVAFAGYLNIGIWYLNR